MESSSIIHTREEQQRLLTPHEYTREALSLSIRRIYDDDKKKPKLQHDEVKDLGLEKRRALDVLGQPSEPICTYYRCHHKFSLHGSRKCRCKHPTNKTLGIEVRYL